MNKRLLFFSLLLAVFPLGGMILILIFKTNPRAADLILLAVCLLQLPLILLCKNALRPFIHPDDGLLESMGIDFVPAPFEPGRYSIDSRVGSWAMWLSLLAPVLTRLAVRFPREVCVTVLNFAKYTAPSMNLMAFSIVSLLIGVVALPFWFQAARACAIYSELSERKRYRLMGFAGSIEKADVVQHFLKARKNK